MRQGKIERAFPYIEVESMGGFYQWLAHRYDDERLSSHEILEHINAQAPKQFHISARQLQRHIKRALAENGKEVRTRSQSFQLAIAKGRMEFSHLRKENKVKRTRLSDAKRYEILKRDNFSCVLCGATANDARLQVDHIVPVCNGGKHTEENMRTVCYSCNVGKQIVEREK